MPLHLKFHGALGEVTGSVSFLRHTGTGHVFAVDCGSAHRRDVLKEPAHPGNLPEGCRPDQLKGLFLTHAHADHVGMLLYWVKAGFIGPIYCTTETARFAYFACEDSLRILLRENPKADVGEAEKVAAQRLLENHLPCAPGAEISVEPGLSVACFPTSHIVGCVGFQFVAADAAGSTKRVFFTGDVGTVEDEQETCSMMRTRTRPEKPSDFVVTESTYGDKQRKLGDRSGKARLERMAEVLERGFRHGSVSKLVFPAFSLQRSQDLLLDIYQVLSFNRAATGLTAGVVPKVYLDSSLASSFMSVFRDVYRTGSVGGSDWVNPSASFFGEFGGDADDIDGVLEKLLRFDRPGACVRLYHNGEASEVFCGPLPEKSQGPAIVICGSGMTNNGAIRRYLYDYVQNESTTFVLSGYVPPYSPGASLFKLCELPAEVRARTTFELKEDPKRSLPKKILFGTDIKADCASVSEFYSGHADGPSVCRYVLGESSEGVRSLRRIFLMHGEDSSRAGLAKLLEDRLVAMASGEVGSVAVECPFPSSPWFDCGADQWIEDRPVTISLSVLVPAGEDILNVALSVFAPTDVRSEAGLTSLHLTSGRAASRTSLRVKGFNATHRKLIAETTLAGVEGLLDAGRVAFRWREVLNALQLQKSEYFAGHKFCANEQEFQEFENVRRNLILGGRQRVHGFVVAGREAFAPEEISALESLLTPHVPFFVLDNKYLSRLNAALFPDPEQPKLSKARAFYVPIKTTDPFVPISRPFGWECLRNLLIQVAADAQIKETRQPARPATIMAAERPSPQGPATIVSSERIHPDRVGIPLESYAGLRVGQKVAVTVEAPFANGRAKGMKLRVKSTDALGVVYGVNYLGGEFDHPVGSVIDVYVRMVDPALRKAEFILTPPCESEEVMQSLAASAGTVTWRRLAELIPCDVRVLTGLVGDYCKLLVADYQEIAPDKLVPSGQEAAIYLAVVQGREQDRIRRSSLPPAVEPFTFEKMARIIGGEWKSSDVLAAARYFEGAAQEELVRMVQAILASSPTGADADSFPFDQKDLFYAACVEASEAGWRQVPAVVAEAPARPLPDPAWHVLRELATAWGVTPAALMLEAEDLGLALRAEVVVDVAGVVRLAAPRTP
jgi:Cft2 family RNA processing exonuclease